MSVLMAAVTGDEMLSGGNVAPVVRRGDAVHRESGPWTPAVHRLLQRLHEAGVTDVPRPLGMDTEQREVLTFLPGDVLAGRREFALHAAMYERDALRLRRDSERV
jgi:hypothetical protein